MIVTPLIPSNFKDNQTREANADQYSNGMPNKTHARRAAGHEEPQAIPHCTTERGCPEYGSEGPRRGVAVQRASFVPQVNDGKEYACIQLGLITLQGEDVHRLSWNRVVIRCNGRIHTGKAVGKVK